MALRLKLNSGGVRAVLAEPGVRALVVEQTDRIARAAGDGFGSRVDFQGDRPSGIVFTDSFRARYRQAREHRLERAIGGG